jgi:alpha-glucosidase (family GH31 glycosyl hydrolase)
LLFLGVGHSTPPQHLPSPHPPPLLPSPSSSQRFNQSFFVSDILGHYASYNLPLHHTVLDVDWHTQDGDPRCYSYGGYTVNTELWPDWEGFVDSLNDGTNPTGRPLKLLLNLHPEGGTDVCQTNWPAFAALIDADPNSTSPVPCSYGVPAIANALFTAFMDAEPLTGVSAWWVDFDYIGDCFDAPTASTPSSFPGIAWSNEVFGEHQRAARGRRPWVLARSGGLGAHRHAIHFTGDANQHQDILAEELRLTPRAANVLDATVSNDVGGFMCNSINATDCDSDPSIPHSGLLYLRWIQAGVTWPIFRTHASEWGLMERRIWQFPAEFPFMADALRLRNALMPYLYSELRKGVDSGVAPVHPLYYDRPEDEESYSYDTQHMFGDFVLSSPVFLVNETTSNAAGALGNTKAVWLPATTSLPNAGAGWTNWNGTSFYAGPAVVDGVFYTLADIPLFALAGCAIPTKTMTSAADMAADPLVWVVFPAPPAATVTCASAEYEDDGETNAFESGDAAVIPANVVSAPPAAGSGGGAAGGARTTVTVGPASGDYEGMPGARTYAAQFRGYAARAGGAGVAPTAVLVNGAPVGPVPFVPILTPSSPTGWFVVPEANHTLAQPAGSLVAFAGVFEGSEGVVIELQW